MKALIYARCSTDEKKQDVEIQLEECRGYCKRQGWKYEEVKEYGSGSKSVPEKLRKVLTEIKERRYDVLLVYDLTRFSRLHPTTTSKMMDYVVENECRFVSMQDSIDSSDEIKWLIIKPLFQYLSWVYSRNLSEKVKLGMAKKKKEIEAKGYTTSKKTMKRIKSIGRPKGSKDKKMRSKKGYYKSTPKTLPF